MITRTVSCLAATLALAVLHSTTSSHTLVGSFSITTPMPASASINAGLITFKQQPAIGSTTKTTTMTSEATEPTSRSSTALFMGGGGGVRTRGLEQRREGPTPTEGGMVLYLKAAEDGTSAGDCPFAHYIRMILEEKGLNYDVQPCSGPDDKPNWLLDYYEGKLPCLKHKKEAYVESNVIAAYLDYFFPPPKAPSKETKAALEDAEKALTGFFPSVAGFLKDVDGDGDDSSESIAKLRESLGALEDHLGTTGYLNVSSGGDDDTFGVLDCRLVPQLYHLAVGIEKFKSGKPDLATEFPKTHGYLARSMERSSFQNTKYSPETIEWGWSNARN